MSKVKFCQENYDFWPEFQKFWTFFACKMWQIAFCSSRTRKNSLSVCFSERTHSCKCFWLLIYYLYYCVTSLKANLPLRMLIFVYKYVILAQLWWIFYGSYQKILFFWLQILNVRVIAHFLIYFLQLDRQSLKVRPKSDIL